MTNPASHGDAAYWLEIGDKWADSGRDRLWRLYCDSLHARLLDRCLPAGRVETLLKTDLFEEALTPGQAPLLSQRSRVVVGMDLSAAIVRAATRRSPAMRNLRADIRQVPFADRAFDVVVSFSTLDHFHRKEDLVLGLREIARVLRPGGHLLVTLDNPANPLLALRNALPFRLLNRMGLVPYFVGATCGEPQLRPLLCDAGFSVLETSTVMHCVRVLAVPLCRLLDRLSNQTARRLFLRWLAHAEWLDRLPTRFTTGNYVMALARKN